MATYSKKEKVFVFIGLLFILAGLIGNEWTLAALISSDGVINNNINRVVIWSLNFVLIGWGLSTIVFRNRDLVANLNVLLLSLFFFSPIIIELFLRIVIGLGLPPFQDPGLYTDFTSDDDYWKLHYEWIEKPDSKDPNPQPTNKVKKDPILGWVPASTTDNPLGIVTDAPYLPDYDGKVVLFYGDSFVEGATQMEYKIPQLLDRLLPDYTVYNYGVFAYGVDQIYLRFKESHTDFDDPFIIIGIYTADLDRSILNFYSGGVKPYFVVAEDGELALKGTPVDLDRDEWLRQNPPRIQSYLLAFAFRKLEIIRAGNDPYALQQPGKKLVNAQIIRQIVEEAQDNKLRLLFVIFYNEGELHRNTEENWREVFLKEQFDRWSVPYLDTRDMLLQAAQRDSVNISKYYYDDGHNNELGNTIIAEAIAKYLRKLPE